MAIVSTGVKTRQHQMLLPYRYRVYTWRVRGQPIPAPRLTQARKYDVRLRRDVLPPDLVADLAADARAQTITRGYYAFKDAVRVALLDAYSTDPILATNLVAYGWPFRFVPGRSGAVAIVEYSLTMATTKRGACRHGDPDNIAKAILDALFGDDRHVLPRCTSLTCGSQEPQVEISVTLLE